MNRKPMTSRRDIPRIHDWEPLPNYGWRCGMYGLRPNPTEPEKWTRNPEFLRGLREGRAQRKNREPNWFTIRCILAMPRLKSMRAAVQAAYREAAESDLGTRAFGEEGSSERWATYWELSRQYEAERKRLLKLRNIAG